MVFIGNPRSETKRGRGKSEHPKIQTSLAMTTTDLVHDEEERVRGFTKHVQGRRGGGGDRTRAGEEERGGTGLCGERYACAWRWLARMRGLWSRGLIESNVSCLSSP